MKHLFFLALGLSLVFLSAPAALAEDVYLESVKLIFPFSADVQPQDISEERRSSDANVLQAFAVELSANLSFELWTTETDLGSVYQRLQLRRINPEKVSNRDVLGITAVEIVGSSFMESKPMRAVLMTYQDLTVVVLMEGNDLSAFDAVLSGVQQASGFRDALGHPLGSEITDVSERGIFSGYDLPTGPEFRPQQGINRAELMKVVVLAAPGVTQAKVDSFYAEYKGELLAQDEVALSDRDEDTQPLLADVDRDAWFAPYIFYASSKNWVRGYPDGTFRPVDLVNVAEAAKIILLSRNVFLDPDPEVWFRPFLRYLEGRNILIQEGENYGFSFTAERFPAYVNASRAMVAAFLSRLLSLQELIGLRYFGQIRPSESMAFQLDLDNPYHVLELGRDPYGYGLNSYVIVEQEGSEKRANWFITMVPATDWSSLEKIQEDIGAPDELLMTYLGENRAGVYAGVYSCQGVGFELCDPEAADPSLLRPLFSLSDQDLTGFDDPNVTLNFFHATDLGYRTSREQQQEQVLVNNAQGADFAIVSRLEGQGSVGYASDGEILADDFRTGPYGWKVVRESVRDQLRVAFSRPLGKDLLLVLVPGISSLEELSDDAMRILRTLKAE